MALPWGRWEEFEGCCREQVVEKQLEVVAQAQDWLLLTKPLESMSAHLGRREGQCCQHFSALPSRQVWSIHRPWALRNSSSSHQ